MQYKEEINAIIDSLTLDEMIGQMMCFSAIKMTEEDILDVVHTTKAGSFFVSNETPERIKKITDIMNEHLKCPGMIAADIEYGPGSILEGEIRLPEPMAWGACNDAELIRAAHVEVARRCREMGVHWNFAPVADINYNPDNPITNVRAVSDIPERVAKICCAAVEGMQENDLVMAGCKHFPGDGMDDRNQHFCITVNDLGFQEWMDTYGYVYKELIKAEVASVMIGHIAFPAYDEKLNDWVGYPPGSLSYNIITRLLKGELGFEGCVVSDALSMIGACTAVPLDRIAVEFVKAGGDILLFPLKEHFYQIKSAVESGEIEMDRIKDAVYRVLVLKRRAGLLDKKEPEKQFPADTCKLAALAQEIADKSITLIRNYDHLLPVSLKEGAKILILNIKKDREKEKNYYSSDLDTIKAELEKRGFLVTSFDNATRADFVDHLEEYDLVLVNCKLGSKDYRGGSLRIDWQHISPFWRGEILRHPKVIFTSFGCPYKIYDFPYLKTYINAYSSSESTQRAFVKALLGEIEFEGKSPVCLKGFFEAED